jgi:PAS domain S-box-containing protein
MVRHDFNRETKSSVLRILSDYPLLYVLLILVMVGSLLVWLAHTRIKDYRNFQHQIVSASVHGTARELATLLSELRRSVMLFALGHREELNALAREPDDDSRYVRIQKKMLTAFPDAFSFALSDNSGQDLLNPYSGRILDRCREDIHNYVKQGFRQKVYIHPDPEGYHFDIMVPWKSDPKGETGVFFISFRPRMLAWLLANRQVPGHVLYLVRNDRSQVMIEVTASGSRETLERDGYLSSSKRTYIDYEIDVPETGWRLLDIPRENLYLGQRIRSWLQVIALFLIFFGASAIMLYLIKREERRREIAEESLRRNHATLNAVFEGIADPVYLKDTDDRYRMVNSAFARWAGKRYEEIPELRDKQIFPPTVAVKFSDADRKVMENGGATTVEEVDDLEDRIRNCLVTRTPVKNAQGKTAGLVGIRHDITELKHAEHRARQHERELAHVDRLNIVGEMASAIAHELNQPLGAVVNYAQACLRMVTSGNHNNQKLVNALELTEDQAQRAGKIIHQIRDFVRKDTRRMDYVNVAQLIAETVEFIQPKARKSGTHIMQEPHAQLPPVLANKIQIEQVLLNIIVNSIEAMENAGAQTREVRILCRRVNDNKVQVTVRDTGPGIDSETSKRIFEAFYSVKKHGMGLGLAISRSIIEAHAGRLWAETDTECGAVFHFILPVAEESVD